MDYEFKSLKELYERITPALRSKVDEFNKTGFNGVKEADIWNYLTDKKWQESSSLTISEMVSDIFNTDGSDIINYIMGKISKEVRKPNLDNTEILDIDI